MCSNPNHNQIAIEDLFDDTNFEIFCRVKFTENKKILINLHTWLVKEKQAHANWADTNHFKKNFIQLMNKEIRASKSYCQKAILLNTYEKLITSGDLPDDNLLRILLQKRATRNVSGITSITLLTSPHPNGQAYSCQHNCYYCPNEPAHAGNNWQDQPRSYLFHEPAVARANHNNFEAIAQMNSRLNTLMKNGHEIDKLEIILEGGTYTEYPEDYLEEFHRDIFYAANTYFAQDKDQEQKKRAPESIAEEIRINQTNRIHIIGVCIETRPDAIDAKWLRNFRNWGVTRIQLGIQHVDNQVLKKVNRGHSIEQALFALEYLKDNCFKIDIHMMPDLPNSTPEMDRKMFDFVYSTICPDQMKIYPCEVVPWTIIEKWYKKGIYTPYFEKNPRDLLDVVKYAMRTCPNYIRLPRIIRDIPISYIESGNTFSNLRQILDIELEKEGIMCGDIRTHEIGRHTKYYGLPATYNIYSHEANRGTEYFIVYESLDKIALFGFIRLRFPDSTKNQEFEILKNRGLIRELHVYGNTKCVGSHTIGAQHKGIGKKLLKMAEDITRNRGYKGIVVISGEGVKTYYEKMGYKERETFMVKDFIWSQYFNIALFLIFFLSIITIKIKFFISLVDILLK